MKRIEMLIPLKKIALLAFVFVLMSTALGVGFVRPVASEVQVGVKAGDWIKCDYTYASWPEGTPYPEWLKVEFLSVEGTNATVRLTMHMSDGTESSENLTLELAETFHYDTGGTLDTLFGFGFAIPANLKAGEDHACVTLLFPSRYFISSKIDGEITRTYAGADRVVVSAVFIYIGGRYGNNPLKYYWDKQTGVLVEASATLDGMTATAKATETNMWETAQPAFELQWWLWVIVATMVVVILAIAGYICLKRKNSQKSPLF